VQCTKCIVSIFWNEKSVAWWYYLLLVQSVFRIKSSVSRHAVRNSFAEKSLLISQCGFYFFFKFCHQLKGQQFSVESNYWIQVPVENEIGYIKLHFLGIIIRRMLPNRGQRPQRSMSIIYATCNRLRTGFQQVTYQHQHFTQESLFCYTFAGLLVFTVGFLGLRVLDRIFYVIHITKEKNKEHSYIFNID
jgi:hypothetical protein